MVLSDTESRDAASACVRPARSHSRLNSFCFAARLCTSRSPLCRFPSPWQNDSRRASLFLGCSLSIAGLCNVAMRRRFPCGRRLTSRENDWPALSRLEYRAGLNPYGNLDWFTRHARRRSQCQHVERSRSGSTANRAHGQSPPVAGCTGEAGQVERAGILRDTGLEPQKQCCSGGWRGIRRKQRRTCEGEA